MSASQRRKGAAFELEVAKEFGLQMDLDIPKRELSQTRDGGFDLRAGGFVIECKRRKRLTTLDSWMAQARSGVRQTKLGLDRDIPIVLMRADQGQTMVLISLDDFARTFTLRGLR
jgi:hypothetical protein